MAEPSHLEHTTAVPKLGGLSPVREMWSPVAALPSATLGIGGSATAFPGLLPRLLPTKKLTWLLFNSSAQSGRKGGDPV